MKITVTISKVYNETFVDCLKGIVKIACLVKLKSYCCQRSCEDGVFILRSVSMDLLSEEQCAGNVKKCSLVFLFFDLCFQGHICFKFHRLIAHFLSLPIPVTCLLHQLYFPIQLNR